jgi:hypothetical protein
MSTHDDEPAAGITDELLPEDLRPTDDNPLAKPLTDADDPKSAEELDVLGGKTPEESSAVDDSERDEGHSAD